MATHAHDRAAILSIGDELAIGQNLDTNSRWLAERLTSMSISVREHRTVGDDLKALTRAITELASRYPLIIATGGLGPTADDLTRQALAAALGEPLIEDPVALERLFEIERARGRTTLTAARRTQALRPASARCLANPVGTAPGLGATVHIAKNPCDAFFLPGPPREMIPMFEATIAPVLRAPSGHAVRTRVLKTFGLPESDVAMRLGNLMARDRNPLVGTTVSGGIVSVRIRAEGEAKWAEDAIADSVESVRAAVGEFIFTEADRSFPAVVLDVLRRREERFVVAESCTAGLIGSMFGAIPGASDCFLGGYIVYSNKMKSMELGVPMAQLSGPPGAVSIETATAMALGALRKNPRAHHGLSVTGIAGPGGGTAEKPVGTVCIARASRANNSAHWEIDARKFLIAGDRDDIRERAAIAAIGMLWHHLAHGKTPRLLWEVSG